MQVPAGYSGGEDKLIEVTSDMVSFEKTTRTEHGVLAHSLSLESKGS